MPILGMKATSPRPEGKEGLIMGSCGATQSMEAQENQGASRADGSSGQREPWEVGGGGGLQPQGMLGDPAGTEVQASPLLEKETRGN